MRLEINAAGVHPGGISHRTKVVSSRRGWRDKRRMRAAYERESAAVNCPNARGAYACPVPARHMRALCW
jgi:hypothetical protein